MPYRVDFTRLRQLRGSRDAALLERVVALAAEYGVDADDDSEPDDEDDGDGDDPEYAALRRFLNGRSPDPANLDAHDAVMGLVCTLCSWPIKNAYLPLKWITAKSDASAGLVDRHLGDVESALQRHGAADRVPVRQLFEGGYPASPPLPRQP